MNNILIRNCAWGYACDQDVDDLGETEDLNVKFCNSCQREVYRSENLEDLAYNIKLNRCVYFSKESLVRESESSKLANKKISSATKTQAENYDYFDDDIPF